MMKRIFAFTALFIYGITLAFADYNNLSIPDSTEIRKVIADSWFYEDLSRLREKRSEIRKNALGQDFQIRLEETDTSFAIVVAPQMKLDVDLYTENGVEHRTVDEYPGDAMGSWLLIRNNLTGKPEHIRIYFSANSDMYVQFSPDNTSKNGKSYSDYVIGGLYACKGVPLGIPFDQLYTASFQELLLATEHSLPWQYSNIQKGQFHSKHQMIGVIRKNLERIHFMPDSCYDENGKPIYISDGKERTVDTNIKNNPVFVDQFGFLKWIVDGLVKPYAGSGLYRDPLLVRTMEYNPLGLKGILDKKEELSFGLDWCRNLAAACVSVRTQRIYMWNECGADVEIEPFASEVSSSGMTQTAGFIKNSGYQVKKLKPLLCVLASTEPTYCYLAAIKKPVRDTKNPEYFKYEHCAVIFPYYDDNGLFSCTIFENGEELSLNQFQVKYKDSFVHLSRVLTETRFFPD